MSTEALTFTEGAAATIPGTTSVPVVSTTEGKLPVVAIGFKNGTGHAEELATDASGIPVQGTTTITDLTVASTNTPVHIDDAASDTELIASNANRKGWTIQNNSTANLYLKLGSGASTSSFHRLLRQYESMGQKIMDGDLYTGTIHGYWASNAGGYADGGDW